MTQEDRIFQATNRAKDFSFDERVASVFDDMISRSVPFYSEVQRIQSDLIVEFFAEN
jgi:tRNA (cmo5U34)-methyltransferase